MSYHRTLLAGLLASLAGVLLLSEMAFAQRSGVRSGVIGNVPAHQRIHSSAIGGGYRGAPIGNRRRSGAIRSIQPSLTGLEPLPTFVRPPFRRNMSNIKSTAVSTELGCCRMDAPNRQWPDMSSWTKSRRYQN